jgi:hypothetical protein
LGTCQEDSQQQEEMVAASFSIIIIIKKKRFVSGFSFGLGTSRQDSQEKQEEQEMSATLHHDHQEEEICGWLLQSSFYLIFMGVFLELPDLGR